VAAGIQSKVPRRLAIELAIHASERRARVLHRKMRRGLSSLATISATAFWWGVIGTVIGIIHSFQGVEGERTAVMFAIEWSVGDSILWMVAGLAIGIFAFTAHRHLTARADALDIEMRNASLELANDLFLFFGPSEPPAGMRRTAENGVDE
jgi:biopolymer transport protein ExbB/TolQ